MGVYLKYGPAPAGGAVFSLSIKPPYSAHVTFPATVTLSSGETNKQFDVTWDSVGSTVIQAQLTEYNGAGVTGTVHFADVEALDFPPAGPVKGVKITGEARICRPEPEVARVV
jgi:hypothetical protein